MRVAADFQDHVEADDGSIIGHVHLPKPKGLQARGEVQAAGQHLLGQFLGPGDDPYAITHWGRAPAFPGGPDTVPVWPGIDAPSGCSPAWPSRSGT
jgi:hypothetical protein